MRTVVYQSFRTENVPPWIEQCMRTVRDWAALQGFEYRFWDDRFFDLVPAALRPRASVHVCLLSDYARVVAARQLLAEGYERTIWVDADAVIFAPKDFLIRVTEGHAFCREVWLDRVTLGVPQFQLTVNNSVTVFCKGETLIDEYLQDMGRILAGPQPLTALSIGTDWLLARRRRMRFPLLTQAGTFGPILAERYLADDGSFLRRYLRYQTSPVHALNLCLSHTQTADGRTPDPEKVIARLLSDSGASLNKWYRGAARLRRDAFGRPLSPYLALRHWVKRLSPQALHRVAS